MELKALLLAVGLLSVAFTGCIGDEGEEVDPSSAEQEIDPDSVEAPEGATVTELEDGVRLVWEDPSLPLNATVPIPEGTTIVNATADVDSDARAWTNLTHATTGLPRCQPPMGEDLMSDPTGPVSCFGMAAPDQLPAEWELTVEADVTTADKVQVDLRSIPLDGLAGQLDVDELSAPVHDLAPVETTTVQGANGTSLGVEIHKPDAEGSFPAILISRLASNTSAQATAGVATTLEIEPLARELAARGYAVAVSDVRGTGSSGGCLDAWGPRERADQAELVGWLDEQDWTTDQLGAVGFGYSATTALEAAIVAPDKVDAVVSIGGVTDAYGDWHFGGVPNGEGVSDLFGGQLFGALGYVGAEDPVNRLAGSGSGSCESSYSDAMDPRAVYNEFYKLRNLTERADQIEAPLMHAQGTFDKLTKPSMAKGLVEDHAGPYLSMVGPWAHQLPTRADALTMMVAWLDGHVRGAEVGLNATATTSITTPSDLQRHAPEWPPAQPNVTTLYPDFGAGELGEEPVDGSAEIVLDPIGATTRTTASANRTLVELSGTVDQRMNVSGSPELGLKVQLQGMENAFVAAYLTAELPDGTERLVSFGMANLAHRGGHGSYAPVPPGEAVGMGLPMEPTEMVLPAGTELELTVRSAATTDWTLVQPGRTGQLTMLGGAQGTALSLPTAPGGELAPTPATVVPPAANPT